MDDTLHLPNIRGKYRYNVNLSKTMWFQVGGAADVVVRPEDAADLQAFLTEYDGDLPLFFAGAGSNLLVRDGGMRAAVIRGGKGFAGMEVMPDGVSVRAGSAALAPTVSAFAASAGISGLEFMAGIPGTVGGLCAMNAGAYGSDIATVLEYAEVILPSGEAIHIPAQDAGFAYRTSAFPEGAYIAGAVFKGVSGDAADVKKRMADIMAQRNATQPVKGRTGGSTFRNPDGHSAWKLIDNAGCRGLTVGGAQVSELHCNFLLNTGSATAADLETLGDTVRERVLAGSGVDLHWEIKRVGEPVSL